MEEFAHSYILVAYDNSTSLSAVFSTVTSLDDFLGRDELMPFHPVSIDDPATEVNIEFDFDGFMIEVSSLAGVKAGIHRLRLPEFCPLDLRNHFPIPGCHGPEGKKVPASHGGFGGQGPMTTCTPCGAGCYF